MSSTGTILASVSPEAKGKVEASMLRNRIRANVLGVFTKDPQRVLMRGNKETPFPRDADDPYAKILSGKV
jgi:hydrogenase maturation factor